MTFNFFSFSLVARAPRSSYYTVTKPCDNLECFLKYCQFVRSFHGYDLSSLRGRESKEAFSTDPTECCQPEGKFLLSAFWLEERCV